MGYLEDSLERLFTGSEALDPDDPLHLKQTLSGPHRKLLLWIADEHDIDERKEALRELLRKRFTLSHRDFATSLGEVEDPRTAALFGFLAGLHAPLGRRVTQTLNSVDIEALSTGMVTEVDVLQAVHVGMLCLKPEDLKTVCMYALDVLLSPHVVVARNSLSTCAYFAGLMLGQTSAVLEMEASLEAIGPSE